ncbi:site-specific integrase [Nonomuraea sp. NPDC050786]|uniref:site-specific integrase n=1 Tax=Nonomuraea sp. NPDC050786 TaxID=3154840 RepID=UPI0033D46B61
MASANSSRVMYPSPSRSNSWNVAVGSSRSGMGNLSSCDPCDVRTKQHRSTSLHPTLGMTDLKTPVAVRARPSHADRWQGRQAEDAEGPAGRRARDRRVFARPRAARRSGGEAAERAAVRVHFGAAARPQGRVQAARTHGPPVRDLGLHPHQLRHTFATLAEEAGVSVKKIQEALDHVNSSTTDIYLTTARRLEDDPSDLVAAAIE